VIFCRDEATDNGAPDIIGVVSGHAKSIEVLRKFFGRLKIARQ
jgi:hypothetical protein